MSNDISTSAGIRTSVLALKNNSVLFDRTTERLATGKKVNRALDNPTNYFAAVNLTDKSAGLESRMDGISQSVASIKAADTGITGLRSLLTQLKGTVDTALTQTSYEARRDLGEQFNQIMGQMITMAKDSNYNGINFLQGSEVQTVQFADSFNESTLKVRGFNISGNNNSGTLDSNSELASSAQEGDKTYAEEVSRASVASSETAAHLFSIAKADTAAAGQEKYAFTFDINSSEAIGIKGYGIDNAEADGHEIDWGRATYVEDLKGVIEDIETMEDVLKNQASLLANNLSTMTIREDFTNELIDIYNEGADDLTAADLNEEGANLLALQTSGSLATQSLSLSSQNHQSVLQLLG